jgi:hypothetical protein
VAVVCLSFPPICLLRDKSSEDIFSRQRLRLAARFAGVRPAKAPLELSLLGLTGKKVSARWKKKRGPEKPALFV